MSGRVACRFAGLSLFLSLAVESSGQRNESRELSAEAAFEYALGVTLGGKKTEIVDKRVGPIRAILTCRDEESRKLVHDAVAAVNDAFGYGKIALSESEQSLLEADAVNIFVGSKSDGRKLVESFGVSSPRAFGDGVYYYWWDDKRPNHISRCLIAIDASAPAERKAHHLRYLLMACMGVGAPWLSNHYHPEGRGQDTHQASVFSDLGIAVVRFFDKHVDPGMKGWEMRKVFKAEWPDFSSAYWNPSSQKEDQR